MLPGCSMTSTALRRSRAPRFARLATACATVRVPTGFGELSRLALRPKRWFRRQRAAQVTLEGFPQPEARRALRRDTVQRALTALPFEARAMVLLRDFVKLSYDELAEVVDVAPRKRVHALARSRAEFGEIYDYIKF